MYLRDTCDQLHSYYGATDGGLNIGCQVALAPSYTYHSISANLLRKCRKQHYKQTVNYFAKQMPNNQHCFRIKQSQPLTGVANRLFTVLTLQSTVCNSTQLSSYSEKSKTNSLPVTEPRDSSPVHKTAPVDPI